MTAELKIRYQIAFIVFIALGIYYPSLFGHANSVDDTKMMTALFNTTHIDLKDIFFPMRPIQYYRPVLWLTFLSDRFLFFCTESFMHLENIILHTTNGILVFFAMKELVRLFNVLENRYVPMLTSLLFVLHPINTEPVNWISGRTDVLAGTFVFLAFFIFLKKGMSNLWWRLSSASFYLLGLLSKEVALAFLPMLGIFLILKEDYIERLSAVRRLKILLPFLLITLVYFAMRSFASGHSHAVFPTVAGSTGAEHLQRSISSAIKAFGFYIKKLFLPVPLNFGIVRIYSTFYFWFGIIMVALMIFLFWRKRYLPSFLFITAAVFFLPAIPIAMRILPAWTPLGERYLYISSFGVSALIIILLKRMTYKKELVNGLLIALLLVGAAFVTVDRNIIWQNNLTLFRDTIMKSPFFVAARNEYAVALFEKGQIDEASKQFTISESLAGNAPHREVPSLNAIEMKVIRKKDSPDEIKDEYLKLIETAPEASAQIRRNLIRFLDSQVLKEKNPARMKELYREIIFHMEKLFETEKSGFYAYRLGQLYLAVGDKKKAAEYFAKAVNISPNQYFSDPARQLIRRLDAKN
jgi:tetratricopeptide (TPR) repeat protein